MDQRAADLEARTRAIANLLETYALEQGNLDQLNTLLEPLASTSLLWSICFLAVDCMVYQYTTKGD